MSVVIGIVAGRLFFRRRGPGDLTVGGQVSAGIAGSWPRQTQSGQSIDQALMRRLREESTIVARTFSLWKAKEKTAKDATTRLYLHPVTVFDGLSSPCQGQKLARITVHGAAWSSFLPADQEIPAGPAACCLDDPQCL